MISFGAVCLETVTVTFKEGKMLLSHRTDQTKGYHFADPKYRSMLGGNHPNDTMKSLGYTGIVIERTNCVPTEIEDFPSSCSPLVPRKIQWTCWPKNCLIPHMV